MESRKGHSFRKLTFACAVDTLYYETSHLTVHPLGIPAAAPTMRAPLRAISKGGGEMQEKDAHWESSEHFQSAESVRLLWEGTRKALDGGIDTKDLVSLCDIIVRLADHRLLIIQAAPNFAEMEEAAKQIRHYRQLAEDILHRASKPAPEPDWAAVAESLSSVGAAPLEFPR